MGYTRARARVYMCLDTHTHMRVYVYIYVCTHICIYSVAGVFDVASLALQVFR